MKSFKPLGAFAAIGPLLQEIDRRGLKRQSVTITSATDGNHGLGLAFVCHLMGLRCVIFVPRETTEERKEAIRRLGATVTVSTGNYDQACRECRDAARTNPAWFEVSDVSTDDYRVVPLDIMRGYSLIVAEMLEQIPLPPDVVFLQGGVGTMAGALTAALRTFLPADQQPRIVVCEPLRAAGILHCMTSGGREIRMEGFDGDLVTKAAGLSCGTPARIGFDVVRKQADAFMTAPEAAIDLAAALMYHGSASEGWEPPLVGGESGVFGLAALLSVMRVPVLEPLRAALGLDRPGRRVWLVSTESDTDQGFATAVRERRLQPMEAGYDSYFGNLLRD